MLLYLYDISMACNVHMRKETFLRGGSSLLPYQYVMTSSKLINAVHSEIRLLVYLLALPLNLQLELPLHAADHCMPSHRL